MGIPKNGWFRMENPNLKWMMTGGTPHDLGNLKNWRSVHGKIRKLVGFDNQNCGFDGIVMEI